jgi:dephospho-CoA kinase
VGSRNSNQPYRVGLTGGIASGKSTVAELFADLGIPVIDTDVIAKDLAQPGMPALAEIRERFGDKVIDSSGKLDRGAMRGIIFVNDDARHDLEAILHPRIGAEVLRQSDLANGPYQIIVIPLLVKSSLMQHLDRVLVVDCSEDEQVRRLMRRDKETAAQAKRILAAQSSRDERLAIADDVIRNDTSMRQLSDAVRELDQTYRHLAAPRFPREQSPETP